MMDSILNQMRCNDVPEPALPLRVDGKKVPYGKGKKAWYRISEWVSPKTQKTYYFGFYGNKDLYWEIESEYIELTPEEKAAFAKDRAAKEKAEAEKRKLDGERAANRAKDQWEKASPTGASEYLTRKGVKPVACRYMADGKIIVPLLDYSVSPARWVGSQKIAPDGNKEFNGGMIKTGAACRIGAEPVDGDAIFLAEGYATALSIYEAIGGTVYMCCDAGNLLPVAKILRARFPVSQFVFCADDDYLLTSDGKENHAGKIKADKAAAEVGNAVVVLPAFTTPRRLTRDDLSLPELVDFNDLHQSEGVRAVHVYLWNAVKNIGSSNPEIASVFDSDDSPAPLSELTPTEGGEVVNLDHLLKHYSLIVGTTNVWSSLEHMTMKDRAFTALVGKPLRDEWLAHPNKRQIKASTIKAAMTPPTGGMGDVAAVLDRFVLLEGTTNVWDDQKRKVWGMDALKVALGSTYKFWLDSPTRKMIDAEKLVFDPTQQCDPETHINLFDGLPLIPNPDTSKCRGILELMAHLCAGEKETHASDSFEFLLRWIAYPLQHVGAKMATSVLMHGEMHGTGKSLFWEGIYKKIFGAYSATLGQHQLESSYTDWKSRKLFVLFEEVLSKDSKYNHMGTIKHTVTGETHRVNQKFKAEWEEANHMNVVFLSNEHQPLPIEPHDRRFLIIWTEDTLPRELQLRVDHEIKNGGIEAFYSYLLNVDLGDFTPHSKPPMTRAKTRLIEYGMPSWERFYRDWKDGAMEYPFISCAGEDLYIAYRRYCERGGEKSLPSNKVINMIGSRHDHGRKWLDLGGQAQVQRRVLVIGKNTTELTDAKWLGDQVNRFKEYIRGDSSDL